MKEISRSIIQDCRLKVLYLYLLHTKQTKSGLNIQKWGSELLYSRFEQFYPSTKI
ncbi:hypothetical protein HNR74_003067 [Flammeovirga kamogawensis]|nr:hypothetical protein [Flammeovirga kamogawensis]